MLRMEAGNRLKSLQPFTAREASLALLMGAGADIRIVFGVASLPFLAQLVKVRSYPCARPSLIVKFCQTCAYDYYDYFASAYIINMHMPLRYLFPVISKLVYAYTM